MPDLVDPTDVDHRDDDLLRRPLPPRSWRERVDDLLAADTSPGRLVVALVAVVIVGALGWRLLAPPAPPPEVELPFAESAAGTEGSAAGSAPGQPAPGAPAGDLANAAPGGGAAAVGDGPGGALAAEGAPAGTGSAGEVVVHVVGAVAAPGVQRLPAEARVVDAVEAAGGASGDADLARINLAATVVDGQQIHVLRIGEPAPAPPVGPAAGEADQHPGGSGAPGLIDINRATAGELEELPGVGPTTAEAIVAHREQHGPFAAVDDLIDVRGIGEAKLEQLRPQATV